MLYGCDHEKDALKEYFKRNAKQHQNYKMQKSPGLQIHPKFPYIAASLDPLVTCSCCGNGIVEVKCPHSIEKGKLIDLTYLDFATGILSH